MPSDNMAGRAAADMKSADMKIVLVQPEIPGNTGTIGRTCVALGLELILIHPLGFDISCRRTASAAALARARLMYSR